MCDAAWRLGGVLVVMASLVPLLPAAEQAWRMDGRHVRGILTLDKGRLHFRSTEGEAIPLADLARIRFADKTPPRFRAGGGRRVRLRDGQIITGQLLGLSRDTLTLRTAWAAHIELPRTAVTSLDPLPGWRIVAEDDFRNGLSAFTATGEPALTQAGSGLEPRAVLLRAIGQALVYTSSQPLSAGRAGINFRNQGQVSGARWTFELLFQEGESTRRVVVTVAGNGEHYAVDTGVMQGETRSVLRTTGWHRLIVQFTKRSLRVTCDDDVLWYNLERGPGGRLKQVTVHCRKAGAEDTAPRGTVAWTEFCLERAVEEHLRLPVEAEQDAIRLVSDDELFGRILQADRRAIEIEGKFGKRSLPWDKVAGCTFRRAATVPSVNKGANVRIMVSSGLSSEADVLDGIVTALDEKRLTLQHALLGKLTFERGQVRELRPLSDAAK